MPATALSRPTGGPVRAMRGGDARDAPPEDEVGAFILGGRPRARPSPLGPPSARAASSAGLPRVPVTYLPSQCLTSDLPVTYQ